MTKEIPSTEDTESKLRAVHLELKQLIDSMAQPQVDLPEDPDYVAAARVDHPSVAGFWNHYIGGNLGLVFAEFSAADYHQEDPDFEEIRQVQGRLIGLLEYWQQEKTGSSILEDESVEICLEAFKAFDWGINRGLFLELDSKVSALINCHSFLHGEVTLGFEEGRFNV